MDVALIESMGNSTVIGTELAISVFLSSLAGRHILLSQEVCLLVNYLILHVT